MGDRGWQHAEWAQYCESGVSHCGETDDVMVNSDHQMRSDADQRNDQEASLARTRPALLEREILMHLEATVVGYGQRGLTGQKIRTDVE